jgi:ubiquinol-cytochrome c reductase iron-sulfur subunit
MSDTNSPDQPGEAGEGAWPEYLTGSASASGEPVSASDEQVGAGTESEGRAVPRRVIGTPSPATSRRMLADRSEESAHVRELPADPDNPRQAKTAERLVALCFTIAFLAGLGFIASYVLVGAGTIEKVVHSNLALGGCLSIALLGLAIGAVIWVRYIMPSVELTEERHPLASSPQDRAAFKETFEEGADASQFVKRPILRRTLIAATVPLGVAPLLLLRDLGPLPGTSLNYTVWRKGLRLQVYGTGRPLTSAEFSSPGSIITVGPEGYLDNDDDMAKAAVIIIKFRPGQVVYGKPVPPGHATITPNAVVPNWTVDNIVAYSKICTHVGCPAALYEQTTHHILCPCHQSTFDATEGARVIFGPATRPLPQLPIGVDSEGYLIALSDFNQPVGPSFWERS